jgi:hypothetical protein
VPDKIGDPLGGHCTVGLGIWFWAHSEADLLGGQSWGDDHADHGRFRMGWDRYQKTCVDVWRVVVDPASVRRWTGYKRWIVKRKAA